MFEALFRRQKLEPARLVPYGFIAESDGWTYETDILEGQFHLSVFIDQKGRADTKVVSADTGEEYVLYKTRAQGTYVGKVREAIEGVLSDIIEACYTPTIFKTDQARMLIEYVRETYGDELEFLWERFPDNGIWRRKDTEKWYCALLTTPKDRFGFQSNEIVELIDLRTPPEKMGKLLRKKGFYPGWHMNKNHWFTILLDEGVPDEEIKKLLDVSYRLAVKK